MCLRLSRLEIGRPGAGLIGVGEIVDFGAVFRSHSAIKRFRVRIRVLGRLLGLPFGRPMDRCLNAITLWNKRF